MTADISRASFRPAQRYSGIKWQQGRTPLDSEENEAQTILKDGLRDLVTSVICAGGTPDDGFLVVAVNPGTDTYDFDFHEGEFVLGGVHVTTAGGSYGAQEDWLDFDLDASLPDIPSLAEGAQQSDLVYLEAWEQEVSATEDNELFETALAGVDTTQRTRVMARLRVAPNRAFDCADAFGELTDDFDDAAFVAEEALLASSTTLQIGFTDPGATEDLCSPSAQSGFLGAHNETFTLMITEPGAFVWTNDTTTYRVQVENDDLGQPRRVQFLTPPRDAFAQPVAGQSIELIPWSMLLSNNEKAGAPVGIFLTIDNGYDADGGVIVDADVPQDLRDWLTARAPSLFGRFDETGEERFFFARIWTNANGAQGSPTVTLTGAEQTLGTTGLTVTLTGNGRRGDLWRFSARPNTPARILPWGLLDGEPAQAPHLRLAPVARIVWTGQASGPATAEIVDCRHRFRPLCRVNGCCRVTVGDDHVSHGDVTSIAAALERLPEEGGHICLLPGLFEEHVTISDKRDITISGCGTDTLWTSDSESTALLTLEGCDAITLRDFAMTHLDGPAILGRDLIAVGGATPNTDVTARALTIRVGLARAIDLPGGADHAVLACDILAGDGSPSELGTQSAVFLKGDRLRVEDSSIRAVQPKTGSHFAIGGLHIGSASTEVRILHNRITGGLGNGITLGSVRFVENWIDAGAEGEDRIMRETFGNGTRLNSYPTQATVGHGYSGLPLVFGNRGCIEIDWPFGDDDGGDPERPPIPVSDGPVTEIRILGNDIAEMGFNGIATYPLSILMPLVTETPADAIAIEDIEIRNNRITGCMQSEVPDLGAFLRQFVGWGGISFSLASDLSIAENRIEDCGAAGGVPICGIFVAFGEDIAIKGNRILRNGRGFSDGIEAQPGRRGGIVIGLSTGGVPSTGISADDRRQSNRPALACHHNEIDAPGARALKGILLGPAHVTDNRLTGSGQSLLFSNPIAALYAAGLGAAALAGDFFRPAGDLDFTDYLALELIAEAAGGDAVNLINAGFAEDLSAFFGTDALTGAATGGVQRIRLQGGETLFNDNQVSYRAYQSGRSATLSAVFISSSDDVSLNDNQIETENDLALAVASTIVTGNSIRAEGGRFQSKLTGALLSAITVAEVMNTTSLNQGSHCFLVVAPQTGRVVRDNTSILGMVNPQFCQAVELVACYLSMSKSKALGLPTQEC
ncbi:DUF6519 domain-containing protein [Roseovarius sp. D22-M7]|uniref:DUF6519 domain-containing protein n=1 Tax=Roseovarius sp. D22-M7 TaxID=3127116 RepID=UPI00300F92C0